MNKSEDPVATWLKEHYGSFGTKIASSLSHISETERDFCDAYLSCGSSTQANRESGLNSSSPQMLLHLPRISAYLNILAAKQEVDLGRKSTAEMLDRIRATPVLSADDQLLPKEVLAEVQASLEDVGVLDEETLRDQVNPTPDFGIMQVPEVTMLHNTVFGPEWVLENLVRVAERCLQIEPVYDTKGRPIGEFKFEANASLKALELVGKTMALFRERIEHTGSLDKFETTDIDDRIAALIGEHPQLARLVKVDDDKTPDRTH